MKFICDVCPITASGGHTVVIGNYEKWIRHLLSPHHQAEQNLVMGRTSYWPEADKIALIKGLPVYEESTVETYVDVMMALSEYGFIEAIYYGSKTKESVCAALQWYETGPIPAYLEGPNGVKLEVSLLPRLKTNSADGLQASQIGKRRFRWCSSTSSDVSTFAVPSTFTNNACSSSIPSSEGAVTSLDKMSGTGNSMEERKSRIKYDRATLLRFSNEKSMPPRFSDVLNFPISIIEEEPKMKKMIDPFGLQENLTPKWQLKPNGIVRNDRQNGFMNNYNSFKGNRNRDMFANNRQFKNGINSRLINYDSRWTCNGLNQQVIEETEEEW